MHVGIAYPRWRGKRSRHSWRMRTRNFTYLARGPWLHTLPVEGSKRQSNGKMVCFVFHSCVLIQRPAMHWRHAQVPSHRSWSAVTPITSMAWVAAAASENIMDMNNTSGHPSGNTEELFFLCDIDLIISRATSEVIIYFITYIIIYIYIHNRILVSRYR